MSDVLAPRYVIRTRLQSREDATPVALLPTSAEPLRSRLMAILAAEGGAADFEDLGGDPRDNVALAAELESLEQLAADAEDAAGDAQATADQAADDLSGHVADEGNPHATTAAQVGADPSGTAAASVAAHAAASDPHPGYVLESAVGSANGVAPLDSGGKVAAAYLPSYVDDVLEFADFAAFPVTGETGKIYVDLDENTQYRWSGSAYVQMVASPGSTDAVPEGATNLYFTTARVRAAVLTGLSLVTKQAIAATDTVLQAFGYLQAQITGLLDGSTFHALSSKATPVDADELLLSDSAAGFGLKRFSWANLKATAKTYFDGLYPPIVDVQVFTTSTDWNRPTGNFKAVDVIVIAGGGGGASGCRHPAGGARFGGGGGASGSRSRSTLPYASLPSTVAVTVGAGGTGGASRTTNNTNGQDGVTGGFSSFGNYLYAPGGTGGNAGSTTSGNGGAPATGGNYALSKTGGASSATAQPSAPTGNSISIASGPGGGGGGISTGNTHFAGGIGDVVPSNPTMSSVGQVVADTVAGTAGGGAGNAGASEAASMYGAGGSGGGGNHSGNGGAGGAGGGFGAGGGGGGATTNDAGNSGAGGAGSDGYVIVITY